MSVNINLVNTIATIAASCPPLLQEPLEPEEAEQLASALKAIAEPHGCDC
jgi:hypothetical protein